MLPNLSGLRLGGPTPIDLVVNFENEGQLRAEARRGGIGKLFLQLQCPDGPDGVELDDCNESEKVPACVICGAPFTSGRDMIVLGSGFAYRIDCLSAALRRQPELRCPSNREYYLTQAEIRQLGLDDWTQGDPSAPDIFDDDEDGEEEEEEEEEEDESDDNGECERDLTLLEFEAQLENLRTLFGRLVDDNEIRPPLDSAAAALQRQQRAMLYSDLKHLIGAWLTLARHEATFANAIDSNGEDCKEEFRGSDYVQHLALYMASLVMAGAKNRPIHWESVELLAWLLKQDPPKMPEDDDDAPVYWNTEIAETLDIMPSIDPDDSPWESPVSGRSVKLYPSPLGSTAEEWSQAASKLIAVKADLVAAVKAKNRRWNE